jgi:hypothetical protein
VASRPIAVWSCDHSSKQAAELDKLLDRNGQRERAGMMVVGPASWPLVNLGEHMAIVV